MKIELIKKLTTAPDVYTTALKMNGESITTLNSLSRLISKLLNGERKLKVKGVLFRLNQKCIGIVDTSSFVDDFATYSVVHSDFSEIKVGDTFVACRKKFDKASNRLPFFKIHYFSITEVSE